MQFSPQFRWFDGLLLGVAAGAGMLIVAGLSLAPKEDAPAIAVVFAPWTKAADALNLSVRSGGRFVRFGAFDFIAVVQPDDPDYARRVRDSGAWMLADPAALAACLRSFNPKKT